MCCDPEAAIIEEGNTSYHNYSFEGVDESGDFYPITTAESIEYRLSDGINVLIDWTNISPPTAPGQIKIPGINNRISGLLNNRILTLVAKHNGGDDIVKTINYSIRDSFNVSPTSPA